MFIIGLFLILFYLLKKSKSDFFFQDTEVLAVKRYHLIEVLYDFEISQQKINDYLEAFNFFASNPELFDGATIVKDLPTIKRLDLPALKHDFDYLTNNFWSWNGLKNKIQYDWNYGQNQEELTVGSLTAYTRSILLILSTPLYYLMIIFKK
tara:strand:- start:24 stop:476 length:453 start_codon:yes stop_codon:yes gene_type:complete